MKKIFIFCSWDGIYFREQANLLEGRFDSLKSYLVGKGVPEDQIRLDNQKSGGTTPEFEMFVVEH